MYVREDGVVIDGRPPPEDAYGAQARSAVAAASARFAGAAPMPLLLYLDQNYLSGVAKRKPAFRELEPALGAAVARGAVSAPEAEAHRIESAARPDLPLLELLRDLSRGLQLPDRPGAPERQLERRVVAFPKRTCPPAS